MDLWKMNLKLMIGYLKKKEKCHLNYFVYILAKKFGEQNKKKESKLHSHAWQIEKKLKVSKHAKEVQFKFKSNEIQHQFNIKLVAELEKIGFLVSEDLVSCVKTNINKLVKETRGTKKNQFC